MAFCNSWEAIILDLKSSKLTPAVFSSVQGESLTLYWDDETTEALVVALSNTDGIVWSFLS